MNRPTIARLPLALLLTFVLVLAPCALADGDAMPAAADAALDANALRALQLDLIAAGYLEGEADGIAGPATEGAIRAAQAALGMPADGRASDALCAALRRDAFPLRRESRGGLVYEVQMLLCDWGFLEDAPTGIFGPATEAAVIELQELARADFAAWMQARTDAEFAELAVPTDVAATA